MSRYVTVASVSLSPIYTYEKDLPAGATMTDRILEMLEREIRPVLHDKPDLIVLDPPRDGINPKALPKILAYEPEQFIYVSCKPTSLVRDLPAFVEAGYHIRQVRCCDMFPMTVHVETVVLLSK